MQKKRENMMDERIRKLEGWDGKKRERLEELRRMKKEKEQGRLHLANYLKNTYKGHKRGLFF